MQAFPYSDFTPFARALVEAVPDRLVWGSDWPHVMLDGPCPTTATSSISSRHGCRMRPSRQRVLVDNPKRLYGFETPLTRDAAASGGAARPRPNAASGAKAQLADLM